MIRAILFDLDGTLLPVDDNFFFGRYLHEISQVIPGRTQEQVAQAIYAALRDVMREAEPTATVEQRFSGSLARHLEMPFIEQEPHFLRYYMEEFPKLAETLSPVPQVRAALDAAKARGIRTVLATNPVFPGVATRERMRWAGLRAEDFEMVTFYEDCRYTKPHLAY